MTKDENNQDNIEIPRLTIATAADLLREYETELRNSGAVGEYTEEVSDTISRLDSALENEPNGRQSDNTSNQG
jgi:hypothetical protein